MLYLASTNKGRSVFSDEDIHKGCYFLSEQILLLSPKDTKAARKTHLDDYLFDVCWENTDACTRSCIALGLSSLINHSESPNSAWEIDAKSQQICFFSLRRIEAGEEITHNYYWTKKRLRGFFS